MYLIKKLIVCLDQSPLDQTLIKYAVFLSKRNSINKIYFVSVIKNLSVPSEVLNEFPDLMKKMIDERMKCMEKEVQNHGKNFKNIKLNFLVKEGTLSKKILKLAEEKSADLILIGRKVNIPGTGVASTRLARRANCALLIIPEGTQPKISNLLVPSDFSDYSKDALEDSIVISKNLGNKEVFCQNVFSIPSEYHFTPNTFDQFKQLIKEHAEVNFKKFIRKIDAKGIKISPIYSLDDKDDPVQEIVSKAHEIKADLIVIGAKGKTAATALFIGSMAERLIQFNKTIPLLITRPKGKNGGVLDYILEI